MASTDKELGKQVQAHLISMKVETPMNPDGFIAWGEAHRHLETGITKFMNAMNLDLGDDSLEETPNRVAKMFCEELFSGLNYENFPKCTAVENKMSTREMVVVKNIATTSVCEHHFQTIDGFTYIGYLPSNKVMGLSKFSRITRFFARRPQVQERMTEQIYYALSYILGTQDVAVYQDCAHYCMKARGVGESSTSTVTSRMGGRFMISEALRKEFYDVCRSHN